MSENPRLLLPITKFPQIKHFTSYRTQPTHNCAQSNSLLLPTLNLPHILQSNFQPAMEKITKPVFYVANSRGWPSEFASHEAWTWLSDHEKVFDFGDLKTSGEHTKWITDDFEFTTPFGQKTVGLEPSWAALLRTYAFFSAHYHEPQEFVVWETDNGYKLMGQAYMYVKFVGDKQVGDGVQDLEGRKWDARFMGKFFFEWVRDPQGHKGLKMKREDVTADGFPMFAALVERGVVTWDAAVGMLKGE